MPKELRKRGKKKKKETDWQPKQEEESVPPGPPQPVGSTGPSWIIQNPERTEDSFNPDTPFGYVDADVKAYFRTVDIQIRDWQDTAAESGNADDVDSNEERRMFFIAALTEMAGKEKQLASDPDCSLILERMSHSMDDFVRRVFVDSLSGSYDVLVKHRFASHVCQTLFTVANHTISREQRGILPSVPEGTDKGELPTLSQLIVDVCEELFPHFTGLVTDPYASHVIRALLLLLSPNLVILHETAQNSMRSKKSANWKARQGPLKSVFKATSGKEDSAVVSTPPKSFTETARKFVELVRKELDDNETRALAANKVASPTLQMLLAVEAEQQMAQDTDSLMDRVSVGLVSFSRDNPTGTFPASDYFTTLLRDPISSHLLETIVCKCPDAAFSILWATYFKGSLPRIALHPVANFVLAKALERVDVAQLTDICVELHNTWGKMIQTSRTGVLRAVVDRCGSLKACSSEINEAIWAACQINTPDEQKLLVPCMLRLQTVQDFKATTRDSGSTHVKEEPKHKRDANGIDEPKIQGAVLLQSLLRLPEPFNQLVIQSLNSLSIEETLAIAKHPIGSRVLDAVLESPTVPMKVKRQFVLSFVGNYHLLVDDRIGSRVGDRCWAFSDTYLKEKIARSLFSQEQFLAGSYYGKFFARNLNLYLLQRRPEEWRTMQTDRNRPASAGQSTAPPPATTASASDKPKKKRKRDIANDEIEDLFSSAIGRKIKKAALGAVDVRPVSHSGKAAVDGEAGFSDVMAAIRTAPAGEGKGRVKREGRS
ncbi:armadillo-type protein [Mycena pura]|uniref:Nucleolar protein 9 n=1 Tax=Mycena pura TaxID=153505 RepID=A0AAD7E547_9AGAR|nr:armadillo-type protein [Mycena pura]